VSVEFQIRRQDFSLSDEQVALQDSFRAFFEKTVPSSRVRSAEPHGFDEALWDELSQQAVVPMTLPESAGGDGAGLVETVLVVEEAGRRAAPVPIADVLAAARALARVDVNSELLANVRDHGHVVSVAPGRGERRLVPSGGIAAAVLAPIGDDLALVTGGAEPILANVASAPIAWWRISGGANTTVVGSAEDWATTEREWQILTAAALVGLGQAALDLGVQYAKERAAFGVPIGSFQAIAHPLVDAANAVDAARRLLWRAAWFSDHEPESVGALALCALIGAGDAAEKAGATAIHTMGGFGFTLESDAQLFYRRAKGWAALVADRRELLRRVARLAPQSLGAGAP
jgi:alkylation response protein AidB-like acyl-CoA dehydrogenase